MSIQIPNLKNKAVKLSSPQKKLSTNAKNKIVDQRKQILSADSIKYSVTETMPLKNNTQPGLSQNDFQQEMAFISDIKLPKNFLGQGLFPRKYQALFEIKDVGMQSEKIIFLSLIPLGEDMNYLDRTVQQAFLKKLALVNMNNFRKLLLSQYILKNSPLNSQTIGTSKKVSIEIEFQEP